MADNPTIDNGALTDYTVSTDEGTGGHVQRVKLAYSADGSETHVTADADGLLVNLGANNDVTVSGVSTAANQSTIIGHLDGVEGLLGTIDADTGAMATDLAAIEVLLGTIDADTGSIATAASTIAGAVSGTEMQVDVLTMPTVAVTGTFYQATQPVSAASLPLPSGAATAAKQPALGTAGTPSADVISIQGVASGTVVPVSDGGGALTVDGTVTANLAAGTNNIGDVDVASIAAGDNNIGNVDIVTVPAPLSTTGGGTEAAALRVTLASDSTGVVSVDDNGGSLTVDGTVTANLSATDNAVLDAIAASLAGTLTVTGVGGTEYTEGDTDASITGSAILWEDTSDTLRAVSAAKPLPVGDAGGSLTVDDGGSSLTVDGTVAVTGTFWQATQPVSLASVPSHAVTNAGTFAVQDSQKITDNGAFTDGTTKVQPVGFIFDEVAGTALTENDMGAARMDSKRAVVGVLEDATTRGQRAAVSAAGRLSVDASGVAVPITDNSGSITVDNAGTFAVQATLQSGTNGIGKLTANSGVDIGDVDVTSVVPGTGATNLGKAEDAAHSSGDVGVMALAVRKDTATQLAGTDGDYSPLITDANGALHVAVASGSVTASGSIDVLGDTAHDAADSGDPVKVGTKAANALPTAVANGDRANAIGDLFGRVLTSHIDPAMQVTKAVTYTSQQTGSTIWDPTSGKRIAITDVTIASYGTTAGRVILWFGANADTTYSAGTDQVLEAASFAPSSNVKPGMAKSYTVPVFCTTADHELHITTDAAMSVDVTVRGYEW